MRHIPPTHYTYYTSPKITQTTNFTHRRAKNRVFKHQKQYFLPKNRSKINTKQEFSE